MLPKLTDGRFMQAFVNKGRFEEMMGTLPVHVVMTDAALLGTAQYGLDRLAEPPNQRSSKQRPKPRA